MERRNLYAPIIAQSTVVQVDRETCQISTLATAPDGLDFPSSVAFSTGMGAKQTLYAVNFAIGPPGAGPALLVIDVGVPGMPVP